MSDLPPEIDQGVGGNIAGVHDGQFCLDVRKLAKPVGAYQAPEPVRPVEPPGKNELLLLAREARLPVLETIAFPVPRSVSKSL